MYLTNYVLISFWGLLLPAAATTWNVTSFGAIGNGTTDDSLAVQSAINACASGDTVVLPPGTYRITSTLTLNSNCSYQGQNNPVLLGYTDTGPNGYLLAEGSDVSNISIIGIVFNGGG